MYEVYIERAAEKDLRKLDPELCLRIITHVKPLALNPRPRGSRKLVGSRNDWRIRVGDYRVLYEIDDRAQHVRIMRVKHRREAYA